MRSGPVAVALATGLLPAGVYGAAINLDVSSVESVLEYFTCVRPIPEVCFDNLAEQATAWCGRYLSIEPVTVYRTTITPVSTETVTETATTRATSVEVDITTVEVTETTTVTDLTEATVTETLTVSGVAVGTVRRRTVTATPTAFAAAAPSCIDLSTKNLLHRPASRLSRACSCLIPQPTTVTLDATTASASTAAVTETSTLTVPVPETTVSTELVTAVATQDVTVTKTTTATATVSAPAAFDPCAQRYSTTVDVSQLRVLQSRRGVATSYECCQLCYNTLSCAGAISPADGQCDLMILPAYELDFPDDSQCRYSWMGLNGITTAEGGALFKGPCYYSGPY